MGVFSKLDVELGRQRFPWPAVAIICSALSLEQIWLLLLAPIWRPILWSAYRQLHLKPGGWRRKLLMSRFQQRLSIGLSAPSLIIKQHNLSNALEPCPRFGMR